MRTKKAKYGITVFQKVAARVKSLKAKAHEHLLQSCIPLGI
jgi:hypothetical protein